MNQRVLGRIRLSRRTDESTAPERQREHIEKWADLHGHTIVGWAEDLDVSGSIDPFDTPRLGPWLRPDRAGDWDILVTYRLDRLARRVIPLNKLFGWCFDHGKTLVSTSENIDLSHWVGRLIANVIAGVAEGELEAIQDRTTDSRRELRNQGRWAGGKPPFGYTTVRAGTGWKLAQDPEAMVVVQRIVADFLDGVPVESTCATFTAEGIPTPVDYYRVRRKAELEADGLEYTGPEPEGRPWKSPTIWRFLESRVLLGHVTHDGKTIRDDQGDPVMFGDPLISQQVFDEIQTETLRRKGIKNKRDRNTGPLLGVVQCSVCRVNLHHQTQATRPVRDPEEFYRYYFCSTKPKHAQRIRADLLQSLVEKDFLALLGDQPRLRRVFIPAEDHTVELEEAERAVDELSATMAEMTSDRMRERLRGQLRALDARMTELEQMPQSEAKTELRPIGSTYGEEWARLDEIGRRNMLRESGVTFRVLQTGRTRKESGTLTVDMSIPGDIRERLNLAPDANPIYDLANPDALPSTEWVQQAARISARVGRPDLYQVRRFPARVSDLSDQEREDLGLPPRGPDEPYTGKPPMTTDELKAYIVSQREAKARASDEDS